MAVANGNTPSRGESHGFLTQHREPWFGIIYGDSGTGKSTACVYAFPKGFFVGPRGGVTKIGITVVGYVPRSDEGEVYDLDMLADAIPKIASLGCEALIVDDLSVLAERTFRKIQGQQKGGGEKNKYKVYQDIADLCFYIRDECRRLNMHAAMNAHAMSAFVDNGVRWTGRPALPGKLAPKHFPPVCDSVLRAVVLPPPIAGIQAPTTERDVAAPWPGVFRNSPLDPDWYTKCRHDTPDRTPMNLGEILRDAGYKLSRAPGLEWQDEMVELAAKHILDGNAEAAVLPWVYEQSALVLKSVPRDVWPKIHRWTRSDVLARVWLRRNKAQAFAQFARGM